VGQNNPEIAVRYLCQYLVEVTVIRHQISRTGQPERLAIPLDPHTLVSQVLTVLFEPMVSPCSICPVVMITEN